MGFPGVPAVKNPPDVGGDSGDAVQSLGWEEPLEEEMATGFQHSCLANPTDIGT